MGVVERTTGSQNYGSLMLYPHFHGSTMFNRQTAVYFGAAGPAIATSAMIFKKISKSTCAYNIDNRH